MYTIKKTNLISIVILSIMIIFNAHSAPPFCDPELHVTVLGSQGCGDLTRIPFESGFNETSYLQYHQEPYDRIDQWFSLSVDNLKLANNEKIHLIEYYRSANLDRSGLIGSLILKNAPVLFGDINGDVFEIFWEFSSSITADVISTRIPSIDQVDYGLVPLLTESNNLCFYIDWQRHTNEKSGYFNISIQEPFNNNAHNFSSSNLPMFNETDPIRMVRAGIVVPPQSPMEKNGHIELLSIDSENCGY